MQTADFYLLYQNKCAGNWNYGLWDDEPLCMVKDPIRPSTFKYIKGHCTFHTLLPSNARNIFAYHSIMSRVYNIHQWAGMLYLITKHNYFVFATDKCLKCFEITKLQNCCHHFNQLCFLEQRWFFVCVSRFEYILEWVSSTST